MIPGFIVAFFFLYGFAQSMGTKRPIIVWGLRIFFNIQKGFPYSEKLTTKVQGNPGFSNQHCFQGMNILVLAIVTVSVRVSSFKVSPGICWIL